MKHVCPASGLARPACHSPERQHGSPGGEPRYTGWRLDKKDLCVAKLCALREKDQNFVAALFGSKLIDRDIILTRLATVDERHRGAGRSAPVHGCGH